MAWAQNVLEDCHLSPLMEWDAMRLEKFNGEKWVRFIHEPWTAQRMWDVQVCIILCLLWGWTHNI